MANIPLPQIEGKYEILLKIKEGGMGAIYQVRHLLLDEIRVIKVIRPQMADSADMQRRFLREARAATRLKHPNIAQLYDFAVHTDGSAYMVMEFIAGVTLQEMLAKNGPAPLELTLEIARQGLTALRYLHQQGYVHRDIAPDNLMLAKDFEGLPLVKLIDLGIVKHLEHGGDRLTGTGLFLGKVRYSSPEQFGGETGLDNRSDIYSFGIMLYELLTGTCPIVGDNLSQLVAAHLFRPPLSFDTTDPDGRVPPEIRKVVLRAIEKDAAKRIASAEEFLELLARPTRSQTLIVDLDQTLSTTIVDLGSGEEPPRPGSTQDRLDEKFGLVRTPARPGGLRVADQIGAVSAEEEITSLFTHAQRLATEQQWEEARRRLFRALAVDPDNLEVRALLATVESSLEQSIEEEKRRQQGLAKAVERIQGCLAGEQVDEAARELGVARSEFGDDSLLSGLETRIAEARGVLAERARGAEISSVIARVEQALDAEQVDAARALVESGSRDLGEDPRWAEVEARIERVTAEIEGRRRREALQAAGREIERLLAAQNADEAASALAAARARYGPDAGFAQLDVRLAELRGALAERARRAAMRKSAREIAALLDSEKADAAGEALAAAAARFGGDEVFTALRDRHAELLDRLEQRRVEEERAARRERARALLSDAAAMASRQDYGEALARALDAAELDPENAAAAEAIAAYREAEVRLVEERRRQEAIGRVVASIDALLAREQLAAAEEQLQKALGELGNDERLDASRGRIDALRLELEDRAKRAALGRLKVEVEALLVSEDLDAADALLARALADHGADPGLDGLSRRLTAAREAIATREHRDAIMRAADEVETLVREEKLDQAVTALKAAVARFGREVPLLQALRPQIKAARRQIEDRERAQARRAEIASAVSAIDALVQREEIDDAQRALESAVARLQADTTFDEVAARIAVAQADVAERQRRAEAERIRAEEERRLAEEARLREAEEKRQAEALRLREAEQKGEAEALRLREAEEKRQAEALRLREAEQKRQAEALRLRQEEERRAREAEKQRLAEQKQAREQEQRLREEAKRREAEALRAREIEERRRLEREEAERVAREREELARQEAERVAREREELARQEAERVAREREHLARQEAERVAREQEDLSRQEAQRVAREQERQRLDAVAREVAAIEALLGSGRLDRAEKRLANARAELGDCDPLQDVARRLDTLRSVDGGRGGLEARRRSIRRTGNPARWAVAAGVVVVLGLTVTLIYGRFAPPPDSSVPTAVDVAPPPVASSTGQDVSSAGTELDAMVRTDVDAAPATTAADSSSPAKIELAAVEEDRAEVPDDPEPLVAVRYGDLVVDASPWAEIRSIRDQNAVDFVSPPFPVTPYAVSVPAGRYVITLVMEGETKTIGAEVVAASQAQATVQFRRVDAADYLREVGLATP